MLERIRQFGGTMNIDSGKSGTKVSVTLPLVGIEGTPQASSPEALESPPEL
jgi:signal transduction histidine kinase